MKEGKICSACKVYKDAEHFGIRKTKYKDCLQAKCKSCRAAWYRAHRKEYREKWLASREDIAKRRQLDCWYKTRHGQARARALKTGMEFTITPEDVLRVFSLQQGKCYWTGVSMVPSLIPRDPQQPSIDRLDPTRGYTVDNIVITCWFVNAGRNAAGRKRFEEFIRDLKSTFRDDTLVSPFELDQEDDNIVQ